MIYRLKQARILSGMTLREAAKGLGFSHQYLHKIEKDGCEMDSEKLIKFANFYKVSTDYLVPNKDRPKIEFGEIRYFKAKC